MLTSALALLPLVLVEDEEPLPPSPFDRILELEIAADAPSLSEGGGPTVVAEYEVEFEGSLHVWAISELDLQLEIEDAVAGTPLASDDDSGGGTVPYAKLEVAQGCQLAVFVSTPVGEAGSLTLHLMAAPESDATRAAAERGREALAQYEELRERKDFEAARELLSSALDDVLGTPGAERSEQIANVSEHLGYWAGRVGGVSTAYRGQAWTLRQRVRSRPPDHTDLLRVQLNLAGACLSRRDLPRARELYEHVHAARERLLSAEHTDLLRAKTNVAVVRKEMGEYQGARELFAYIHAVRERQLPADHPDLLRAKLNLAATRTKLGDLLGALELEEEVHATRERLLPADHPQLLSIKHNLAVTLKELGDLSSALELFEHVHAVRERLLPAGHRDLLVVKLNLARIRGKIGDLRGALELKEHVHAMRESSLDADHPALLESMRSLAVTRLALSDWRGAQKLFEQVHATCERSLPPDHPDLFAAQLNLAVTLKRMGDHRGALELEEHVHAARERLLPADHPHLLITKQNLAATRKALGDPAGALELEVLVHTARERLFPPDHPDRLRTALALARTCKELGDSQGLYAACTSLLEGQVVAAQGFGELAPRVARSAALRGLQRLEDALALSDSPQLETSESLHRALLRTLECLRLASTSSPEISRAARRVPELGAALADLARIRRDLAAASQGPSTTAMGIGAEEVEKWRRHLVDLADERDRLQRVIRVQLEELGMRSEMPTVPELASALEDDTALVSFLRYRRHLEDPDTQAIHEVDSLLAFVLTPDGEVRRVELGPAAELEELVAGWRARLGEPIERGVAVQSTGEDAELSAGRSLRARVLDPCLEALGEGRPRALSVVPDEFLYLVPFDALPGDGRDRVGDLLEVRIETSVARLARPKRSSEASGTLVAFGGIAFDAEGIGSPEPCAFTATPPMPGIRSGAPKSFRPLLQSRFEVEAACVLYESLRDGEAQRREGAEATKSELFALSSSARYLHLATHGWFVPESETLSMIDSAERTDEALRRTLSRTEDTLAGYLPETLCGLALAGANHGQDERGRVPGILTAEELATLDLSNCELAVLSACETNVGKRRAGQGIQSLQTSLHAAGVRTAITSLWKVDDAATRKLFEIFYTKLWEEGLEPAEALWQAKLALRGEGHPLRDWAGWVLTRG